MRNSNPASTTLLALDAAAGAAVALLRHQGRCITATTPDGLPHSRAVIPLLEKLLAQAGIDWPQIDSFALGCGPGSFTGIRIAAATMNGVNAVLQRPITPLDSLAITAAQAPLPESNATIWVVEDARMDECFVGCYRKGKTLQEPRLVRWQALASLIGEAAVISRSNPPDTITTAWHAPHYSRSEAMIHLCQHLETPPHAPRNCYPRYLQPTQAER
ncbi:MAG: tRNA (adenosine(37)-N6)-threonylcarbamoyltransferase complex dimerization subunit type 1 TsaB [Mariprofundales bacterium]|nr:tRNA (adenosine(37)-N6)-threonylcarbamoyltransferase complex dimerization subunit type 1 TsaB [Mariprofundales bacterium]